MHRRPPKAAELWSNQALAFASWVCLANCDFASHRTCHNVTPHRCMLLISRAVLILSKHRAGRFFCHTTSPLMRAQGFGLAGNEQKTLGTSLRLEFIQARTGHGSVARFELSFSQ